MLQQHLTHIALAKTRQTNKQKPVRQTRVMIFQKLKGTEEVNFHPLPITENVVEWRLGSRSIIAASCQRGSDLFNELLKPFFWTGNISCPHNMDKRCSLRLNWTWKPTWKGLRERALTVSRVSKWETVEPTSWLVYLPPQKKEKKRRSNLFDLS